jgi:hypothetical protein
MRQAINEVKNVFIENIHAEDKKSITAVVSKRDMLEIVQGLDFALFGNTIVNYEGEYFLVTTCDMDGESMLFVEDVYTPDGVLKYDETEILIVASNLPQNIQSHAIKVCEYEMAFIVTESTTYEEIVNNIE